MPSLRGVRLPFQKEPAISRPTEELSDIRQVVLPYAYATEAEVRPAVSLYDTVRHGTPLSAVPDDPEAVVLSSATGVVSGEREVVHPLYGVLRCAVIDCVNGEGIPEVPAPEQDELTPEDIIAVAKAAHIVDEIDGVLLSAKLRDRQIAGCDYAVADGVQIQPYESSAWAVLRDAGDQVLEGLRLAATAMGTARYHVAVCLAGKRRRELENKIGREFVYQTESVYPLDERVRRGRHHDLYTALPGERVECIGVQACAALYRAVCQHRVHDRTVVTVAGDAIERPCNVSVPFGTTVQEVLNYVGLQEEPTYLILGDSMTGIPAATQDIPILPGMTCILALTATAVSLPKPRTCIGCGLCVSTCHRRLLPVEILRRFDNMHYERLASLHADECDGCGVCSYVCPCGIDVAARVQEAAADTHSILMQLGGEDDA